MIRDDIKKAFIERIAETMEIAPETIDTSKTWDDLDAYSIDVVHIVAMISRDLGILVPREAFSDDLRTVDEFIDVFDDHHS